VSPSLNDVLRKALRDAEVITLWDFDKPSRALVACDGEGHGVVLWWVGGHLEEEIEEAGLRRLDELGLDDAPQGLSVWEGRYEYFRPEDDPAPHAVGTFRDLTDPEAEAVLEGRNPWDPAQWKMEARKKP
jgi:hypothetical protein